MKRLFRHPRIIIAIIGVITAFFAFQLQYVELDNDVLSFVPEENPERQAIKAIEDEFGTNIGMSVGIKFKYKDIFHNLKFIQQITEDIEKIELVDSVQSIANMDYIQDVDGVMETGKIMEGFDENPASIEQVKKRLFSWELYEDIIYSSDFMATQIIVDLNLDTSADEREYVYAEIKSILEKHEAPDKQFYVAGTSALTVLMSENMLGDIRLLIPLVVLIVLASLYLSFRRFGGVLLPILTVTVSAVWAIGLMAFMGEPLSMIATITPVLLVAVGSAYGIHIINHYYFEIDHIQDVSEEKNYEIVMHTLKKVGKPVILAGITTIAGFGSLSSSDVEPMRMFGIYTAIGVLVALLVALTVIPALLILNPGKPKAEHKDHADNHPLMTIIYNFFDKSKSRIVVLTLLTIIIASIGSSMVIQDNSMIGYFKEGSTVVEADSFLDDNFVGSNSFDIIVDGGEKNSLYNPEILKEMDNLSVYLGNKYPKVAKVMGFNDLLKRINQVMHAPSSAPVYSSDSAADSTQTFSSFDNENFSDFNDDSFSSFVDDGFSSFGDENSVADGFTSFTDDSSDTDGFSTFADDDGFTSFGDTDDFGFSSDWEATDAEMSQDSVTDRSVNSDLSSLSAGQLLEQAYIRTGSSQPSASQLTTALLAELNYQGSDYYEIPFDPSKYPAQTRAELQNLIEQYMILLSSDVSDWMNSKNSRSRMTVQLHNTGNSFAETLKQDILQYAEVNFPEGYTVEISGIALVQNSLTEMIVNSQSISIALSLTIVFIILAITFRSAVAGIIGLVPIAFTILINFGIMGLMGIYLDVSTAMVASIAIGIGIDYTIHFMSHYREETLEHGNLDTAARRTLMSSGKAIIFNAASVGAGFAVLALSNFNPIMYLGMLIAITMGTSSLSAMTVLPAILHIFKPKFLFKNGKTDTKKIANERSRVRQ